MAIAILFSTSVLIINLSQTADAMQSTGNPLPDTTSKKVCGDHLCSKVDSQHMLKHGISMMYDGSPDISLILERMDNIHEHHQQQMTHLWNTLTPDEKLQVYRQMQEMIEKMESVDLREHMYMVPMQGKDHYSNMTMYPHEKYSMADNLATQHLKTFDDLDFDVFTNQKWDRLKESHSEDIIVH